MLRNAYEVNFTTSKGDGRKRLMDAQPLHESDKPISEGRIVGYAVMILDEKGGNLQQLSSHSTDLQGMASFGDGLINFRDTDIRVINCYPVKVEWPTGEIIK